MTKRQTSFDFVVAALLEFCLGQTFSFVFLCINTEGEGHVKAAILAQGRKLVLMFLFSKKDSEVLEATELSERSKRLHVNNLLYGYCHLC